MNNKFYYLVLQVYCSPSLKELLHNPVMTVLACNIERKEAILHGHSCVCVVVVCDVCCTWKCGCVYIYIMEQSMVHMVVCVHVWVGVVVVCTYSFVRISTSAFRMVDTNLQMYVRV